MIDFSFKGSQRYYIQSALNIDKESKREQETLSLNKINDSFKKNIVVKDDIIPWHGEKGVLYIGKTQWIYK